MRRFTRPALFRHEHRFSDAHLRSRAELALIADHHRDLAAHGGSAGLAPAADIWRIDPPRGRPSIGDPHITHQRIA